MKSGNATWVSTEEEGHFKKIPPETYEKILAHTSFTARVALSQTCKQFHQFTLPFLAYSQINIDYKRHFIPETTFELLLSKNAFWLLAKEYSQSDAFGRSVLSLLRIGVTPSISEKRITLSLKIGRYPPLAFLSSIGTPHPVYYVTCPHGGVFIYAPHEQGPALTFVNDAGDIHTQSVFEGVKKLDSCHFTCNAGYLGLNIPFNNDQPIVFVPYKVDEHGKITYQQQTAYKPWPQFSKDFFCPLNQSRLYSTEDFSFTLEEMSGMNWAGLPAVVQTIHLNPARGENMTVEQLQNQEHDPVPIFPSAQHYDFPTAYNCLGVYEGPETSPFLFLLGRLKSFEKQKENSRQRVVYNDQKMYSQERDSYPYGIILMKKQKTMELFGRFFLYETRKLSEIDNEFITLIGSYLFITTYLYKSAGPKITVIDISALQRLGGL